MRADSTAYPGPRHGLRLNATGLAPVVILRVDPTALQALIAVGWPSTGQDPVRRGIFRVVSTVCNRVVEWRLSGDPVRSGR